MLLDAPPILPTADSLALSNHADAFVLVVDLNRTTRDVLHSACDRISHTQIPILGFIEI
jgi:receptor protein-tyrosine kinase